MQVTHEKRFGIASPSHMIDLNMQLVSKPSSTYFFKVEGEGMSTYGVHHGDVLIVDRSMPVKENNTIIAIIDGECVLTVYKQKRKIREVWGVVTYVIHHALRTG